MRKLLKDPLLHFLLLGGALFAVSAWRADGGAGRAERIVINAAQVDQLRRASSLAQGRDPTRAELERLIDAQIRDEVYYREALALGLDRNDDDVRRRLIEKMQYLTQDLADPQPASETELRAFFDTHPALFAVPETVTFEQVFFSPGERGEDIDRDVRAALARLSAGGDPAELGDSTPLQSRFVDAPRKQLEVLFGEGMTEKLFAMAPGEWHGPYRSDFGLHLVRVTEHKPGRQPKFDEAREQALNLFAGQRRKQANDAAYAKLRAHYDVVIDWPDATGSDGAR